MFQQYSTLAKNIFTPSKSVQRSGQMAPRAGHETIMQQNSAGGYTYVVSDKELLERILILGTNANTYYANATKLTVDAIDSIKRMITEGKGQLVVDVVNDIYESGRAPRQDATFFVLALVTQSNVPADVKKSALDVVAKIRTFSQLYQWENNRKLIAGGKKGFGRSVRKSMLTMIKSKTGQQFAYQATKYRSRKCGEETWSIDDIIKCSHIPSRELSEDGQLTLVYLIKGMQKCEEDFAKLSNPTAGSIATMQYLRAVEAVKSENCTVDTAIQLIRQHKLPREVLNTSLLASPQVWNALLFTTTVATGGQVTHRITMPITALFRNLGVMTQRGIFDDQNISNLVSQHITNEQILRAGRVHPLAVLVAKLTYDLGRGIKGKLTWPVNKIISDALETAFYTAFGTVEGTGKRVLHAVDCSGSMTMPIAGAPYISSCQAVSTLVMESVRRETLHAAKLAEKGTPIPYVQDTMLFNSTGTMVNITSTMKLADVMKLVQMNNFGSTDCAQPMIKALDLYKKSGGKSGLYDLFVVYTDNETYYSPHGKHPSECLDDYIKETGIDAKLVVYATTPTQNTIGYNNPRDVLVPKPGIDVTRTLNIAGFDLHSSSLIRNFAMGSLGNVINGEEDDGEEMEE